MMPLEELLWIVNDSTFVKIFSTNGNVIGKYDGKDSIPEELGYYEVTDIFTDRNELCIEVYDEEDDE